MRIIQSMWTGNEPDMLHTNFGWLSPEYNLMSWALSCLQLKQFYPEVVLYCDSVSAKILIDALQLPYSDVVCNLDVLNSYNPQLWALPKIHSYSQQEKPFLHVDGDVFVWEKFDDNLLQSSLIAQNEDQISDFEITMRSLETAFTYFPKEIIKERKAKNPIRTYNAGIYGGSDISFFQEYSRKAFEFVDKNTHNFSKTNIAEFNVIFEQYLFYCLAKDKGQPVNVLFSQLFRDNQYKGFGDFDKVPFEKKYLHLFSDYKKSELMCKQLANRLRQDYPIYYYRIIELFRKNEIPLFKNYYFDDFSQKDLVLNYASIKNNYLEDKIKKFNSTPKLQINENLTIDFLIEESARKALDKTQIKDASLFCKKINSIVKNKFSLISHNHLYGRDVNIHQYFQFLFEDIATIYQKKIIAEDIFEIIESSYDWSYYFEKNYHNRLNVNSLPNKDVSVIHSIIIPECDIEGFSISIIDNLDLILLGILEKEKTVQELLDELKVYFDEDDLNESKTEFEMLLFRKLKKAIHNKSIRVLL
ncbi:DUF6734 family protein [Flavobacterium gawalongense]|uniref:DUF6734 domain-containing protein n=1 Tax=Flavobacterium gawalongense TaxID=2594432 RepID=A0A553BK03_9FLAO|nr:DUF6734 family protein [Flavobacterium gawalongense]TRX00372.1 hypothetical protein FNW33_12395 [Flavobacterium gawalongense]TRX08429.1 hypothetical protein FNW12_04085 [Flavobacterium gawalongense]TRX08574.1 hypothetical protein FNW11_10995 [Flavobacterium gawalongense]TRX09557.1 hypothetical protein FNW10_10880 [Flavobacterium gawalongense]TRX25566.1 hypothetical protein FNW38_10855 [Flavobacterium gawalongense]